MMGFFVLVSVIQVFIFSEFTNGQQHKTEKVDVEVYYETLCPFAREFIVNQLGPLLKGDLSRYIKLSLIPYGKATTFLKNDSYYEFECDHGEAECYGNKLQACALVLFNHGSNTPGLEFNKEAVEFIVCLMKDLKPKSSIAEVQEASEKCKVPIKHGVLRNCTNSILGSQSLANLGNLTDRFQDRLRNVPTIVFNGVFRKNESVESEKNFKKQFCLKIKSRNLTACQEPVEPSTGPTILPLPQLSLGITLLAFLGIHSLSSY